MEPAELLEIISRDEDGNHQFKADFNKEAKAAPEMVAFSNSGGGQIFIGVANDGTIAGLKRPDMGRLNKLVSNAASQHVHPPINPRTQNIALPGGLVMVVTIADGISKPYMDNDGVIWVKSGADKRKATAREEVQRLYQSARLVLADETPANGISVADLDLEYFKNFFEREYKESLDKQDVPLPRLLENLNLAKDGILNIAGALLFSKRPQFRLPVFIVKAVCFPGDKIDVENYLDSRDITGKLFDVFQQTLSFIIGNLRHRQGKKSINSLGDPEIPRITLEELLTNALIHRDYFVSASVRIFIFRDKVEIISPGRLPNNLTIENIKRGISNIRNPTLASYSARILPYRGLGSGIRRALEAHPQILFEDDRDGNQFKVTILRVEED